MRIRPARPDEADSLRELVQRAYAPYVDRIGRRPAPMDADYASKLGRELIEIAEKDGRMLGLIVLIPEEDSLLIENVAVDPSDQGRGIGRALLSHAERVARSRQLGELRLYTNAAMTENLALYPRLGYEVVDRRIEAGFNRVYFRKTTPPS